MLIEEIIQVNKQTREHTKDYIQICLMIDNYAPDNVEVKAYLDLRDQLAVTEHESVDAKVVGTPSILSV